MVTRVTDNNCDQALLANGIADPHGPAWFFAYASCRGISCQAEPDRLLGIAASV
jgi:hypothetical protein